MRKEISELLANKMSNADEDEVEDELEALEAQVNGTIVIDEPTTKIDLPDTPNTQLQLTAEQKAQIAKDKAQMAKDRAARRARERAAEQVGTPMLA
jgi:charged multivesicular body protein 6